MNQVLDSEPQQRTDVHISSCSLDHTVQIKVCSREQMQMKRCSVADLSEMAECWPLMSTRAAPSSRNTLKDVAVPCT